MVEELLYTLVQVSLVDGGFELASKFYNLTWDACQTMVEQRAESSTMVQATHQCSAQLFGEY